MTTYFGFTLAMKSSVEEVSLLWCPAWSSVAEETWNPASAPASRPPLWGDEGGAMSNWSAVGSALGFAYETYAMALLLGCLGLHALLLVLYAVRGHRPSRRWLLLELPYGLVNPVAYLLIFQPALFRSVTPEWLVMVSWSLLAAYWALRLLGTALGTAQPALARAVLAACLER